MRKTKVFGTLGPAVDSDQAVRQLILAGMDAARFNFSHGTHASHLVRLDRLKRVREELGRPVAAMLDSRGPEIRIRTFAAGPIRLRQGDAFILTCEDVPGDETRVSVTCGQLHEYVAPGCRVLLDDGLLELVVARVEGPEIHCTVETGGELSNSKSIHIPGVSVPLPALTEQDERDLQFAAEQGFDMIAASHVRTAGDVEEIRAVLKKYGGESIHIIAKIENQEGLDNLDEILAVSDGVLVARGDLGVEIPVHRVPVVQKEITARAAALGKPVIVATQMLDSMMRNPRPTRAEVSDVANAVFDGVSCVLLTGETASGKYPLEALQTAVNTVTAAEEAMARWEKETMPG